MTRSVKSMLSILMGLIILVADLYWTYTSYYYTVWLALGAVIFVADIAWLLIDLNMMRGHKR